MKKIYHVIRLRRRPRALPVEECEKHVRLRQGFGEISSKLKKRRRTSARCHSPRFPSRLRLTEADAGEAGWMPVVDYMRMNLAEVPTYVGTKAGQYRYHGLCPWGSILFLCFIFFTPLSAYGNAEADRVIAIVNHQVITKAELDAHSNLLRVQMGEEVWRQLRMSEAKTLETLVEDLLILQEARRKGINVDERSVTSRFERIRKGFKTDEEFSRMLSQQGLSIDALMKRIKEQMLVEEFIQREIRSKIFIGPKEVTDFYEEHIEEFSLSERVEVENIFVTDKSLAEDIYAKLKLGLDFKAVKENYSEKEGISGVIKKGELRREIDEVIFSLAEGAFSAPIEIKDKGYFIFFVRKKYPPDERKELIEVQERIRDLLSEREFQKRLSMLLEELKKKSYIVIK